jgi:hypothetical protein
MKSKKEPRLLIISVGCDTCVSQVLIAVKCAVAGSLSATCVDWLQGFMLCMHPGKWLCG